MRIEIICIGSELLFDSVNTDNVYISEKLAAIGLKVSREITAGDDSQELENIFSESINRSNIIIVTGGLGPTFDDITREVVSKVTKKKLIFDKDVMKIVAERFFKRNSKMPKENEKQAYILDGAQIIPNNFGTAPGQILELNEKIIILLPGPPKEIKPMFENTVLPYLKKLFEKGILRAKILHITGLGESAVNEKIKNIIDVERELEGGEVTFTILAKHTGVDMRIMVSGTDEMIIDKTIKNIKTEFYEVLKETIYGEDNQTLEGVVGELLAKKRKTLAIAESCTGGLIANIITNVDGSSLYFKEGVVTYSDISKKRILGVKDETLNKYGAVSEEVAKEMAEGIRTTAKVDFGLSTTGIVGSKPSSTGKPAGLVYIGFASDEGTIVKQFNFFGSRVEIKDRVAAAALDILRRKLI
ncbi:MAG: competence/damage-inducible protein A [Elusimicrobia bacterium]|nr:competence/damage-inducible protein A [Elusimicrobiota bacterium]